jgi:protein-tyrosine phosphatase
MGNICRSPSAEAVMNKLIDNEELSDKIKCDSAGTIGFHEGEPADSRMKNHALKRGYDLTSTARQFRIEDFENFDYIIVMDQNNYSDIIAQDIEEKYTDKVSLMTSYCSNHNEKEVPDPYYGGSAGFEKVLDLLEDAGKGLLKEIKKVNPQF